MALLLPNNTYVKLDKDGSFIIYKNKTTRNKEKRAPSSEKILAKYTEILQELAADGAERSYYDKERFRQEYNSWEEEALLYRTNLTYNIVDGDYPLMKQYFPDIKKSIPEVVDRGRLAPLAADTVEKVYEKAKQLETFGKVDEVIDI